MRFGLPIKFAQTFGALSLLILSSCTCLTPSSVQTSAAGSFCDIARPITWSDKDTGATLEQIKEHNAVGVKLCAWH